MKSQALFFVTALNKSDVTKKSAVTNKTVKKYLAEAYVF
jgi:hypothetical protein